MKYLSIFLAVLLLQSCNTSKKSIYWVSGMKSDCVGVAPMKCLNVHKGNDLENPNWENFYSSIEGFEFQEGYLQKIEVKEEKLNPANVPADASSVKYTLVKTLEKQPDGRAMINGSWRLTTLKGSPINRKVPLSELTIDVIENHISGTDGCNNYSAELKNLNTSQIELSPVTSTKKMCLDMSLADQYNKVLNNVTTYEVKKDRLMLYNATGKEILSFLKINTDIPHQNLHDIWAAVSINGKTIDKIKETPRLEINLTKKEVMGMDGCNNYNGTIQEVDAEKLIIGNIASTRKMCQNMDVSNRYNQAIQQIRQYNIEGSNLIFLNENGEEVLAFKMVD